MQLFKHISTQEGKSEIAMSFFALTDAKDGLGISEGTYKSFISREKERGNEIKVGRGGNGNEVWLYFEKLPAKYRELAQSKWGNPYEYVAASIIREKLTAKPEDLEFVKNYRYGEEQKYLPEAVRNEYTLALKFLNLLNATTVSEAKKMGFDSKGTFNQGCLTLIKADNVKLPTKYVTLMRKVAEYGSNGPQAIIHKGYGNQVARKVADEVSFSLLMELLRNPNGHDFHAVADAYNVWAKKEERKEITPQTVGNYYSDNELEIVAFRKGSAKWRNKFDRIEHSQRPSSPLLLINSDDNDLDLYYINVKDGKTNNYHRVVLLVVIDAYNDYPLGYAIGHNQTVDLVKEAYLNAVHHVKELTGEYVYWHQIKADKWGEKALGAWYDSQGVYFSPSAGNARSKVIEQSFGKTWHKYLKAYHNYCGHNITAQERINPDNIQRIKKSFPLLEEAPAQVAHFINRLRDLKKEQWLEGYRTMPVDKKKLLSDRDRLLIFGREHTETNTLTNGGLQVTLKGDKIIYDIPVSDYQLHVGKIAQVKYDPYELNQVLALCDNGQTQIVCPVFPKHQMAVMDMQEGDRARLNVRLADKKAISQGMLDNREHQREVLQRNKIDAQSYLMAGELKKEVKQVAERTYNGGLPATPSGSDLANADEMSDEEIDAMVLARMSNPNRNN